MPSRHRICCLARHTSRIQPGSVRRTIWEPPLKCTAAIQPKHSQQKFHPRIDYSTTMDSLLAESVELSEAKAEATLELPYLEL